MASFNARRIVGAWRSGYALDLHTLSSTYAGVDEWGHDRFNNTYSELGLLLHRLKYQQDQTAAAEIIALAVQFVQSKRNNFDFIIPVPASAQRTLQPVLVLATGLGAALGLPVNACITTTRPAGQLKSITDPAKRKEALQGLHTINVEETRGKNILLFDDLFRSGSTMNAVTNVLLQKGKAANVYALTITCTRSNR